jgi:hypothetical protein
MPDPDILSEAQAAASLRVHPKTLARWRKAKQIDHDRTPGGRISYRWSYLIAFRRRMMIAADAPICSHMSGEDAAPSR